MFNRLSLKAKLLVLCAALLFFTTLVGGVSYWGINKIDSSYAKIAGTSLPSIKAIDDMYTHYQQVRINLRTLGMPGLSKEQEEKAINGTLEAIKHYEDKEKRYQNMKLLPGEKKLYDDLAKNWIDFKAIGTKVLGLQKSGSAEDHARMVGIFLKECPEAAAIFDESIKTLINFHEKNAEEWVKAAEYDAKVAKQLQNIIMIIGVLGGLSVGYYFALTISKLLNDISNSLSSGSDKIAVITTEISSASSSLSSSIGQQATALQQTSSAVEETNASVASNADNAKKSAEVSELSKLSVHNGKEAALEVINSINEISTSTMEIKNQIDESNKEIADIVKIINEIGAKTKVINEIVFQTKLLSFNASVEAARAGEHGKGFSVVAEEIGNLARMSGDSSKEISDLLESSIVRVQSTIEKSQKKIEALVEESQRKVESGIQTTNRCSDVLDEIISNVNNVDSMIAEISSASNEQSHSIREITKAMSEIDSASHQNSSSSKQNLESAQLLGEQVEDFRKLVTKLNKIVGGQKAA